MKQERYHLIDSFRGLALINMVLFHLLYDMRMIYQIPLPLYQEQLAYIWQQSICWTFIIIGGISWNFSKNHWKRGLTVFGCGLIISMVTLLVIPEEAVKFGILSFMGLAVVLMIFLDKWMKCWNPYLGAFLSFLLFLLSHQIAHGYIGIGGIPFIRVPGLLYANEVTTLLGLPEPGFVSSDYFPLFPWMFLFLTGYFLWKCMEKCWKAKQILKINIPGISFLGRRTILFYMLHQPMLMGILGMLDHFGVV